MEDRDIIALYRQRSEEAIARTQQKYGALCRSLARNILTRPEDAEECVADAWLRAWNAIPPAQPENLGAWLCRAVRNLAIDRWRRDRAQKRFDGAEVLLSELEDCIPHPETPESRAEQAEITAALDRWLDSLAAGDRWLFVRRYWHGDALTDLAKARGLPAKKLAKRMYALRQSLRQALEKEDIDL